MSIILIIEKISVQFSVDIRFVNIVSEIWSSLHQQYFFKHRLNTVILFLQAGADQFTFHWEAVDVKGGDSAVNSLIEKIRAAGLKVLIIDISLLLCLFLRLSFV